MANGTTLEKLEGLFQDVLSATTEKIDRQNEIDRMLGTILDGIAALSDQPHSERTETQRLLRSVQRDIVELRQQVMQGNFALSGLYSQIETLVSLIARGDEIDREELRKMQREMRERIFDAHGGLRVEASGDVHLSGDVVGRDKKETERHADRD